MDNTMTNLKGSGSNIRTRISVHEGKILKWNKIPQFSMKDQPQTLTCKNYIALIGLGSSKIALVGSRIMIISILFVTLPVRIRHQILLSCLKTFWPIQPFHQ